MMKRFHSITLFRNVLMFERGASPQQFMSSVRYCMVDMVLGSLLHGANAQAQAWSIDTPAQPMAARSGLATTTGLDGLIYAIGGRNSPSTVLGTVETYNPMSNTWTAVASLPTPRGGLAAVTGRNGLIYAIGGNTGGIALKVVETYNTLTHVWTTLPTSQWLKTARSNSAATVGSDGKIYVIGGWNGKTYYNTAEVYDPAAAHPQWKALPAKLNRTRAFLAAATDRNGMIYAVAGESGITHPLVPLTMEVYNPNAVHPQWSFMAGPHTPRWWSAAATGPDGRVYAIGGANLTGALSSVEVCDYTNFAWTPVASLNVPRYALGASMGFDGTSYHLYAVGGMNNVLLPALNTIEQY